MEHLIVMHELEGLSQKELLALYCRFYNLAMDSDKIAFARRIALTSLENITRTLNNLRAQKSNSPSAIPVWA
jgi:hypothetical protein